MTDLQFHELCPLFPPASAEELEEQRASIEKNGQIEPVVFFDGKELDGRNRATASREEPKWTKEPPTEEGWYFLTDSHCARRGESPTCNEIVHAGKSLYIRLMRAGGESWELLDKFCAEFNRSKRKLYWQKIDIPALSEKEN